MIVQMGALAAFLPIIPFVGLFVMTGKHRNRKKVQFENGDKI